MKITKDTTIGEIVRKYPNSVKVLIGFGLGCVGCPSAQAETIEEACQVHGIKVDDMLTKLNETV